MQGYADMKAALGDGDAATMNLSLGERPVYTPVITFTAPSSVATPFSNPSRVGRVSCWMAKKA